MKFSSLSTTTPVALGAFRRQPADTRHAGFLRPLLAVAAVSLVVGAGLPATATGGLESRSSSSRGGGADLFLSPSGSDGGRCTASAPCRSLARAYEVADLGAVVQLAGGTYGDQLLDGRLSKARDRREAPDVVFRPAEGARVELGRLEVNVPHVEVQNMRVGKWKARYNVEDTTRYAAGDLTFRNVRTHHFSFNAVQNVRVIGGEVGPNRNRSTGDHPQDGIFIGAYPPDKHPPTDILLDGVYVHDITEPDSKAHSDCIQFTAGVNVVIRNSRFRNCEHADMMIKGDQGPIDNFLIENNFLDHTLSAHFSINIYETDRGCRKVLMRNNTALQNIRTDACSGMTLTGNIQPSMSKHSCSSANAKLSWNVYESGVKCGAGDTVAAVSYVDRKTFDLRLTRGSAAIGRGNPDSAPRTDIEGHLRPLRARADAGAHQREPATIRLGLSIGVVRLGSSRSDVEAFHGRRVKTETTGRTTRETYRVAGGVLWAWYRDGAVVGVGTSSPYYSTSGGIGPGSTVLGAITRLPWDKCRRAYRQVRGGTAIYFTTGTGKAGGSLTGISFVRRNADNCSRGARR
jgi:hypothetical protein